MGYDQRAQGESEYSFPPHFLDADAELSQDLDQARTEMSDLQRLLAIREQDMEKLQDALNGLESSTQRLGESHTNDRFSLTVEMDRVKRDLVRCQEALETAKSQSEQRDEMIRERDMDLATLVSRLSSIVWEQELIFSDEQESEVKDLASQLAYQTQTRLNITDKYDQVAKVSPSLPYPSYLTHDESTGPSERSDGSHEREGPTPCPRRTTQHGFESSQSYRVSELERTRGEERTATQHLPAHGQDRLGQVTRPSVSSLRAHED